MKNGNTDERYLGVVCQHCGEPIAVPGRLMSRQIVVAEDDSDPTSHYIGTLLNLRCKACRKEYFYDVNDICSLEGKPRKSEPHSDDGPRFLEKYHSYTQHPSLR